MRSDPPISDEELAALFTFLARPNPPECTHTHSETIEFLSSCNLPIDETVEWLRGNGGHCDCEVIYNVADTWGHRIGWQPPQETDGK